MGNRWINAVIEVTIPLDVRVDAAPVELRDAGAAAMDRIDMPDDAVATLRTELVEDGEPVEPY